MILPVCVAQQPRVHLNGRQKSMRPNHLFSIGIVACLTVGCDADRLAAPFGSPRNNSQQKREAREKLLLLEKQQAKEKIDDLEISIRKDLVTLESNRDKLDRAQKDWEADRLSTYDSVMLKQNLDKENEYAERRREKFLRACQELRDRISAIDKELKQLYQAAAKN
jgi:hypothetical protein